MLLLRDPILPATLPAPAVAIGNFDGMHRGHQRVLATMFEIARANNLTPTLLTFEPHPRMFFRRHAGPLRLEPFHAKARRLRAMGVELLIVQRFTKALSEMPAERFVGEILHQRLGAAQVITGSNFMFGYGRSGDSVFLQQQSEMLGFGYASVAPVRVEGEVCSSTALRAHLTRGEMAEAARLLGRPYSISGRVRRGAGRGTGLNAATANLSLATVFQPAHGVYVVRFRIDEEQGWRDGVANLGVRPTFEEKGTPLLEVHGFEAPPALYGKRLEVAMLSYLRPEISFPDAAALKAQIQKDCAEAKIYLQQHPHA